MGKEHVRDDESVTAIALQYHSSAAPLFSAIRFGHRVESYPLIPQPPLRAVLQSGNRERVVEAWEAISEISAANADWIVVRGATPVAAREPDFVDPMERELRS